MSITNLLFVMIFKPTDIEAIAKRLCQGEVGIFPFDTLFGLTSLVEATAIERINRIKSRLHMAFIVIVPSIKWAKALTKDWTALHKDIVQQYWPAPLSIVFNKSSLVSDAITASQPSVAIRYAEYLPLQYLLSIIKRPLISTSVNKHQDREARMATEISQDIRKQVDFVYDDIEPLYAKPSTLIDIKEHGLHIIRQGVFHFPKPLKLTKQ